MADVLKLSKMTYIVVLGAAAVNLATGLVEPTIAPYLEVLGATPTEIGIIYSMRFTMVAVASLPLALFASRLGLVRFLYLSGVVTIIGGLALAWSTGIDGVLLFYLFLGLAQAIQNGPGAAVVAENAGTKRVSALALFFSTWMIPPAVGAAFSAVWFRDVTTYNPDVLSSIFPIVTGSLVVLGLAFVLLMFWTRNSAPESSETQVPVVRQFRLLFAPLIVLPLVLLLAEEFMSGAGAGATLPFLTPYLKSLGATPAQLSLLVVLLNLSMGVATQLSAPLAKKFGDLRVYAVGTGLSVICLLGIVFSGELYLSAGFFVLRGMFANMNAPIGQSRILNFIHGKVRATGIATATTARWVGWTVFSPISGQIIERHGYHTSFTFTSGIYVIAMALFVWVNLRFVGLDEQDEESTT